MKKYKIMDLALSTELSVAQEIAADATSGDNPVFATAYAVSSFVQNKIDELKKDMQTVQDGRFYFPDGITADGVQSYRMLSSYVEDGTGVALTDISQKKYVKDADGKFVEVVDQ